MQLERDRRPHAVDELVGGDDHDEAVGGRSDELLPRVRAAAALHDPPVLCHLVGAVDRDVETRQRVGADERLDRQAGRARLRLGAGRCGHAAQRQAARGERRQQERDRRPRARARPSCRPRRARLRPRRRAASRAVASMRGNLVPRPAPAWRHARPRAALRRWRRDLPACVAGMAGARAPSRRGRRRCTSASSSQPMPSVASGCRAEAAGIYLDYAKQRVTEETVELLVRLAEARGLPARIEAMFRGDRINVTEDRPALHVALRMPRGSVARRRRPRRRAGRPRGARPDARVRRRGPLGSVARAHRPADPGRRQHRHRRLGPRPCDGLRGAAALQPSASSRFASSPTWTAPTSPRRRATSTRPRPCSSSPRRRSRRSRR